MNSGRSGKSEKSERIGNSEKSGRNENNAFGLLNLFPHSKCYPSIFCIHLDKTAHFSYLLIFVFVLHKDIVEIICQ